MARYMSILDTIGRTPLVRLDTLSPPGVNVYVKVESFNPMGSVKDRMALAIIEAAEADGRLKPGQTVIEATSGNTGISLAMVCARKGYPLVVTMAENFSIERRKLLRFLGAQVVLTPASAKGSGMKAKAEELAAAHGWFLCGQFESEVNADVHTRTTAREILDDMAGDPVDWFVSGFGSGGTLKGVARALKQHSPATRIIAAEPDNSPLLRSGVSQPRHADGRPSASHAAFRPHLMQGWSPDFLAKLVEDAVSEGLVDQVLPVSGRDAMATSRMLASREGIFAGTSAGATLAVALDIARTAPQGSNIVCVLPDTGERYLSTPLFADVTVDMDEGETALSRSTPGYRFDSAPAPAPAAADELPAQDDPVAESFVDEAIARGPVVMFALEWCEFCWSARKFFAALDVPYISVELDAVDMQRDQLDGRVRGVLANRTGARTIPQIYIGGRLIGGCTDLFAAWQRGEVGPALQSLGVPCRTDLDLDPYSLMPNWLHARKAG